MKKNISFGKTHTLVTKKLENKKLQSNNKKEVEK